MFKVNKLKRNPANPRQIKDVQFERLKKSIQEFGAVMMPLRPIVYDENGVTLGGNMRLQAIKALGIKEVPDDWVRCVTDLTDEQKREFVIKDNNSFGEYDWDVLSAWDDLPLAEWGVDVPEDWGTADVQEPGAGGDDYDAEPDESQTRVRFGEIWQCGRHRIGCLDSLDEVSIKKLLGADAPRMVWSDPPYGISIVAANGFVGGGEAYDIPFGGRKSKGDVGGTAAHMRKTGKPYIATEKQGRGSTNGAAPFGSKSGNQVRGSIGGSNLIAVGKYYPVAGDDSIETAIKSAALCLNLFDGATQFWWGGNYYAHVLPPSSCWVVWDKENTGNFADAELAWCSDKSAVRIFKHMWNGLMKESEKGVRRVHPTQKPVALAVWCFEKYGKAGDVIFDPFLGSGISLIAAERLNRTLIGCELSPDYINACLSRWESETGQTAELMERAE